MTSQDLKNKIAVVTGAASGIGAAISKHLAAKGARVGLLDIDETAVETVAADMLAAGSDALGIGCNVAHADQCQAAINSILERFGGIDILVNNAGITQRSAFVDTQIDVYRQVMDVNFFGSLHCTKYAIASIIERRGSIVVIESLAGVTPLLGRTGYCASKHALHGLFTSLRTELFGTGVHIMIVCPGFVRTNLQSRALGHDGRITTHPQSIVGKQYSPERVASAVYKGLLRKKPLLILSPVGKLSYWISRITPNFYERLMARQLKSELMRNGLKTPSNVR
jgi:NAD(P)-dependent dehydrogenase (short-subunit alcohol dehydrogenase family)